MAMKLNTLFAPQSDKREIPRLDDPRAAACQYAAEDELTKQVHVIEQLSVARDWLKAGSPPTNSGACFVAFSRTAPRLATRRLLHFKYPNCAALGNLGVFSGKHPVEIRLNDT
jgi:hypothetical protein